MNFARVNFIALVVLCLSGPIFANADRELSENQAHKWFFETIVGKNITLKGTGEKKCFSDAELANVCHLPLKDTLSVAVYRDRCPADKKITEVGIRHLGRCLPNLQKIDLDANDLKSLAGVEALPLSLREIKLIFNYELASVDFSVLGKFPKLTSLNLQSVMLKEEAIESLKSDTLQMFEFDSTELENLGVLNASRLPALSQLKLERKEISSADLEAVFSFPNLVRFSFLDRYKEAKVQPEAKEWMVANSDTLLVDLWLDESELSSALSRKPRSRVIVRRPLSDNEWLSVIDYKTSELVITIAHRETVLDREKFINLLGTNPDLKPGATKVLIDGYLTKDGQEDHSPEVALPLCERGASVEIFEKKTLHGLNAVEMIRRPACEF